MDEIELARWINKLIHYKNIKAFYNSALWEHLRLEVLDEQNHECQMCRQRGRYSSAVTVHHIKHVKKYPHLALTKSNLMAVCKECHNELHPEKNRNYIPKVLLNEEKW